MIKSIEERIENKENKESKDNKLISLHGMTLLEIIKKYPEQIVIACEDAKKDMQDLENVIINIIELDESGLMRPCRLNHQLNKARELLNWK